jgi:WD40 repeat protein
MAPEQAAGQSRQLTTAADVYALGAILYELLTGQPPFKAATPLDTLVQVMQEVPVPPRQRQASVPRDLEVACLKCLEKDPGRRYASAADLANDLERFVAGEAIVARPAGIGERCLRWVRRSPARAGLAVASIVAVLALVGVIVGQFYNARLRTANAELEATRASLATTNIQLQTTLGEVRTEKANARHYFYMAQMTLAERARQEGQAGRVVQLLRSVIPESPDQEDLRGFEWYHLWRLYHGEESRLRGHAGAVTAVAFSPDDRLLASGSADRTVKLWDVTTGKEVRSLAGHTARVTTAAFRSDGKLLASAGADRVVKLWDPATGQELRSLEGHAGSITDVVFSPDGRRLASASEDKSVRLWDVGTGQPALVFTRHEGPVHGVDFSPDGKRIASVSAPGGAILWDAITGEVAFSLAGGSTSVAFSPDGKRLATGSSRWGQGPRGTVLVWDLETRTSVLTLDRHQDGITRVAFSADGKQLASSSLDQTVKVWDTTTGKERFTFHEERAVRGVSFSPDGLRLASGSDDHTVKLWAPPGSEARLFRPALLLLPSNLGSYPASEAPAQSATIVGLLASGPGQAPLVSAVFALGRNRPSQPWVNNVVFSPDGQRLAGASGGKILVWDARTGKELVALPGMRPSSYPRVAWSPDGNSIAVGHQGVVFDTTTAKVRCTLDGLGSEIPGVAFSPDGKLLAGACGSQGVVRVWDATTGLLRHVFPLGSRFVSCVGFSPDGTRLAVGSGRVGHTYEGRRLRIWDLTTSQEALALEEAHEDVWCVAVSPDGRQLAAAIGSFNNAPTPGQVHVWDAATGDELYLLRGHPSTVWSVAFSPDGKRLASAGGAQGKYLPGEAKIWDLQTGQEVCTLRGHQGAVYGVAFSPDGRRLATASKDGTVKIWDGTPLAETPARDAGPPGG